MSDVTVIDVTNSDLRPRPDMTANVTVEIARASDVLRVPNAALRLRPSPEVLAAIGEHPAAAEVATAGDGERGALDVIGATAAASRPEVWVLVDGRLTRVAVRVGVRTEPRLTL